LRYPGFAPAPGRPVVTSYLNGASGPASAPAGSATAQTLPPYSLTSFVLRPAHRRALPAAPGTPAVTAVTDTTATVSWPAAKGRHRPGRSYEVHLQDAAGSHPVGRTARTTLALRDLRAGTRYTVTVVTRDVGGTTSWSTPAVAFVTGTPADSTCAVHVADTNDWGNGYVGSLGITNTGTEPVEGWRLEFAFPRPWQSFGSGWSATWTAEGVHVTAADPNTTIAPGSTVSVGYVGNYAGPNILPRVFTLNGTVCTTR
ncbi:MAG: hypothetical protein QG608_3173, partial [Actinomycetota bacterium]|nr:hypothetical protein [Actinomycetota bacterium]